MNTLSSTRFPMARFPAMPRRSPLLPVVALLAACGDDAPPVVCPGTSIPQVGLRVNETRSLRPCFDDPEGESLRITAKASDPEVVSTLVWHLGAWDLDPTVQVKGLSPGTSTVTITAEDPGGQTASIDVALEVFELVVVWRADFDGSDDNFEGVTIEDGKAVISPFRPPRKSGFTADEWELTASLGEAKENDNETAPGFLSYYGGTNPVYLGMLFGYESFSSEWFGAGDDRNFTMVYYNDTDWWTTDDDLWGYSDACEYAPGELMDVAFANLFGDLTATCGTTVVLRVNRAAKGWPHITTMDNTYLWAQGNSDQYVEFDWVQLSVLAPEDEQSVGVAWDEGPPEVPDDVLTFKRGVDIPR
ncbi:MAG: hypothetical protein OXU64_12360 [Gemmatimonadota bacterium]|nr:hypothetical protein [Gemmatimonadota bacterium]